MAYDNGDNAKTDEDVGRHVNGGDREPEVWFGGGVLVGAVVIGLIWTFMSLLDPGGDEAADSAGGGDTSEVSEPLVNRAENAMPSVAQRCTDAVQATSQPLQEAGPAMDQWSVHIGAMNKLVVGAISLAQATAFWNRTRVGARHRITQFRNAVRTLRGQGVDCPGPDLLPAGASPELRSCARQADADLRTLQAARTAINTWAMHVRDMERLRTGQLSPADATRMWLMMWQRGQDELDAYRAAAKVGRAGGGCLPTPAP